MNESKNAMVPEVNRGSSARARIRPGGRWLLLFPVLLSLAALNPWFHPDQHDDVTYYFGARSILETGQFAIDGAPITDWPPIFSTAVAGLMFLTGGASVWIAKLTVLAFMVLGVFLIHRFLDREAYPCPVFVTVAVCLLPISYHSSANVLSEWPYLAMSIAFLLALGRLEKNRSLGWAMAVGAMLAVAALTRFIGVFLGIAVVAQAVSMWRRQSGGGRRRLLVPVLPEAVVAVLGASGWLLWKLRNLRLIEAGSAEPGNYAQASYYFDRFSNIEPVVLLGRLEDMLFSAGKVSSRAVELPLLAHAAALILGAILILGMGVRFRSRGVRPSDWYGLACLLLLLGDLNKPVRYFMPFAPFLVGYVVTGFVAVGGRVPKLGNPLAARTFAAGWLLWLLCLDGMLLFRGNASGNRGGFNYLVSRPAENYYRGEWRDLYRACRAAGQEAEGKPVFCSGFHKKYALAFADCPGLTFGKAESDKADLLVHRVDFGGDPEGWTIAETFGAFGLYRRDLPSPERSRLFTTKANWEEK